MHDSTIGNFVTIAPNAVILGRVNIGDSTYIGANSTILPDKSVGENAIVGAGAVVTKNFDSNSTIKGIPAK
jgi:acetyltransferase-like isoleucine patch superfamily enzyme